MWLQFGIFSHTWQLQGGNILDFFPYFSEKETVPEEKKGFKKFGLQICLAVQYLFGRQTGLGYYLAVCKGNTLIYWHLCYLCIISCPPPSLLLPKSSRLKTQFKLLRNSAESEMMVAIPKHYDL